LVLALVAGAARAHELGTIRVTARFHKGGSYEIDAIVDREHVGPAQAKDQKHLDRPHADAADRNEALDEFFIRHFQRLFHRGHYAVDGFLRQVFHRQDFRAGKSRPPQHWLAKLQHFLRRRSVSIRAQGFHPPKNRRRGFAGNGLVGD